MELSPLRGAGAAECDNSMPPRRSSGSASRGGSGEPQAIAHAGELEHALDRGAALDEREVPSVRAGRRVRLQDEPHAGAVEERDAAQIEQHPPEPGGLELLDARA